jgi:uncharacterized membrane protein YkoI
MSGGRRLAVVLAVALLAAAPGASAGATPDGDDAARARAGVRAGRLVPLDTILDWIETRYHGRAIEIELEEEDGEPPVYEVEWLTPQGRVVELEFDARSGALREREGRGLEDAAR